MLLFKDTVTIRPVWFFSMNSVYVIVAILFLILMSGLYPAFILTEYKPIEVLKGRFSHTSKGILLRRVFTSFQFILTIGMIAGVIIIFRQMKFLSNFNLGLNKDHIVTIRLPEDSVVKKSARAFADVLKQQSEVIDVSVGSNIQPGGQAAFATTLLTINGKKKV